MLVLSRGVSQMVRIGNNALVIVDEISEKGVVFLIYAPFLQVQKGGEHVLAPEDNFIRVTSAVNETVVIGSIVAMVPNRVKGRRASIGFMAPEDVRILRAELKDGATVAA
ncbi:MAG: carbon storage regulator [Candidatus Peribacteraceae bacterium]|nr:carbon storage regulator [Candidatus Peribacteraceae bacterium]